MPELTFPDNLFTVLLNQLNADRWLRLDWVLRWNSGPWAYRMARRSL